MSIANQGGKNGSWEATPGAATGGICLLVGVAAVSRPPVLHGVESASGRKRLRFLCGDALCPVLRGSYGASVDSAGHLLSDDVPDHSSISKTHKRLPKEVFDEVFQFILSVAARKKLLWGEALGIDSTTIQANASMKSIVRKDSGKGWKDYTKKLAKKAGLDDPTDDELRQFDRTRPEKKVSNDDWQSPSDPDSRITRMKNGTTRMAYKAEHAVDLDSDLIVSATVHPGTAADTATVIDTAIDAAVNLEKAGCENEVKAIVADKGYHSTKVVMQAAEFGMRTYIPEREGPTQRRWSDKDPSERHAVYATRRRTKGARGKLLSRARSELVERSFAHVCDTGGARRTWLRGLASVTKRHLMVAAARNLSTIMRVLFGIGCPKALQGLRALLQLAWTHFGLLLFGAGKPIDPVGRT